MSLVTFNLYCTLDMENSLVVQLNYFLRSRRGMKRYLDRCLSVCSGNGKSEGCGMEGIPMSCGYGISRKRTRTLSEKVLIASDWMSENM
jgi:hypothetical protein